MFNHLNLLRCSPTTKHLCRNVRSFSFIHQNSANVISKKNGTALKFFSRLKSNNSATKKAGEEVKAQKVKLKISDLRRLLSLAKQEKWKITGEWRKFRFADVYFVTFAVSCRRNWLSHHLIRNHNGSSFWIGQNPRYYLHQRDSS